MPNCPCNQFIDLQSLRPTVAYLEGFYVIQAFLLLHCAIGEAILCESCNYNAEMIICNFPNVPMLESVRFYQDISKLLGAKQKLQIINSNFFLNCVNLGKTQTKTWLLQVHCS